MKFKVLWIAGLMLAATAGQVQAAAVFSSAAVVSTVDRSATFDSLTSYGIDLSNYSEDSMFVTVNNVSFVGNSQFFPGDSRNTGFHYGNGGNNDFVTIAGTDGAKFTAIDFLLGDGWSQTGTILRWQTYLAGTLTGSGTESIASKGTVVGWTDSTGFDELRVAALGSFFGPNPGFGNYQAIAIDDVRAQLYSSPVPEPASIAMWTLGALGMMFARRKRRQMMIAA